VCRTRRDKSKMSLSWYQYAISQMDAVSAAIDALNKHLGRYLLFVVYFCIICSALVLTVGHSAYKKSQSFYKIPLKIPLQQFPGRFWRHFTLMVSLIRRL